MRIVKLIVKKTKPVDEIIREITFNPKGLSLIVDNTTNVSDQTGNNVGKTTVIKIIDLCLGAKSVRELYYDSDTKSENREIKNFLTKNKVQAMLILADQSKNITIIQRDLFLNGGKFIDGVPYNKDEFWAELKKIIFDSNDKYPTFRQLITKFVRVSGASEESMIKYLPGVNSNDTYDAIYSYLFKILNNELVSRKNDLCAQLSECQKAINLLEKNKNISSASILKQKKELIDKELQDYTTKRSNLSYMETYKEELEKKRKLTSLINDFEERMQLLDFEINVIKDSISKLDSEKSNINLSVLKNIYSEASIFIPDLHNSFEKVVNFHNEMIQNRIDFITEQLNDKQDQFNAFQDKLDMLLEEKNKITIDILDEGLLNELNVINKKIEGLSIQKGEIVQCMKLLEEQDAIKNDLTNQLQVIEGVLDKQETAKKISIFNRHFSDYCQELYSEKYLLAYNENWKAEGIFPITLDSLGGNVGTGKKKAVIVAFDLAYLKYAEEMKIYAPKFVIHDKLENTHINQLRTIFNLCQNIDGQYIIPILRERVDKLDSELIEKAKVLELSSTNKFFKV